MSDYFEFAMGEFTADFPCDRLYAKNHMWAIRAGVDGDAGDGDSTESGAVDGPDLAPRRHRLRLGLTAYAVRLLQDVYFLDWLVEAGQSVGRRQQVGSIESKKAESDLYAPVAGIVTAINEEALEDPSVINASPYGLAWLLEFQVTAAEEASELLPPEAYADHLVEAWDVAQRTIKGQANG